ncbi:MAG TPA: GAF domain-containing protein, partial [Candidatus Hydrogenedentes bacterium]|nr:GAF domain-containing protein [Candidatus Hydrogenedentota bacterium]
MVLRPTSAVYQNINLGAGVGLLASIFVIATFCVIAYRKVHNNIVRPLALLNEGAQIIRQGDLDLKLRIDTGDELEELAASFNRMALALKQNIRQLEDSEEEYRSLVTSMRDGVCQSDPKGYLTFANPAGLEIFEFRDLDEAIGQPLRALFLDQADYESLADQLAESGFVERTQVWMKRRDGTTIGIELSVNRVFDDRGQYIADEAIFRDVTLRVRLEQEARERSERIAAINQMANAINSSLEAGLVHESMAAELKQLVDFDYAAVALVVEADTRFDTRQIWPEPEPDQSPLHDGPDSCAGWVAREARCLSIEDLRADTRFDEQFPEAVRSALCVPLYARERIIGALILGSRQVAAFTEHDEEILSEMAPHVAVAIRNAQLLENLQVSLTEVTRAREELYEANEKLKTLDEMKTNLLSNVSHELRTPLVSIMGYTDMILHGKAGPTTDTQQEYLDIILRNVEKLVTLIENLLDFSRIHKGAKDLVFDTLDLAEVVRTSIQIVKPVADGRSIRLEFDAPKDPVLVEGDKGKLGQVFNNLLSNAVKFNRPEGTVSVALHLSETAVEAVVRDTGIGIPAEELDKIFTRFYQVDDSSTRKYGGTGIGLAIAQDIVRLHGDRITVTSQPGQGSVFRFSLPLLKSKREGSALRSAQREWDTFCETHLLVELVTEDRTLSLHVRNLLVPDGIEVLCACDPKHALALAQKYAPDCLVVDTGTNHDDYIALERLLAHEDTAQRPIIVLADDDEAFDCY